MLHCYSSQFLSEYHLFGNFQAKVHWRSYCYSLASQSMSQCWCKKVKSSKSLRMIFNFVTLTLGAFRQTSFLAIFLHASVLMWAIIQNERHSSTS